MHTNYANSSDESSILLPDIWAFVAHASTGNQIELDAGGERVISNQDYCQHDRILYEVLVRPDDI